MPRIAVILPIAKSDYLANTVLDGLLDLGNEVEFRVTENYPNPFSLEKYTLVEVDFITYAKNSDLVILCWGKNSTNFELAEKINQWNKTVFVDGSELGKNNRFDKNILDEVVNGKYKGIGAIDQEMLSKCKRYFRREKPYINGIIPFSFGIETRYRKFYKPNSKREIDFTCIFGQDEYPLLRRQVREYLEKFCKINNFVCHTKKTKSFNFDDNTKKAGRDEFYEILSKSKVGISIGGGGFDTARFWEILGNGCLLMTEKIGIDNSNLKYERITEFNDLEDFKVKLEEMGKYLKTSYVDRIDGLEKEYEKVLAEHSTKTRVKELISKSI